jgi:GNAT superfamily N-acetyltransferase
MNSHERGSIDRMLAIEPASHRSTALRHAVMYDRPGLWRDDPANPSSLVWLRSGDGGGWEAFGAGEPGPALGWIEPRVRGSSVALLAPSAWKDAMVRRGRIVNPAIVRTFLQFDPMKLPSVSSQPDLLSFADARKFTSLAPHWALRSWGDFALLVEHGMALGLRSIDGLVALAWTYESEPSYDKIGVATLPRYQRLGLGRRVASALLDRIVNDRRKDPIWVTTPENTASIALANSLGFRNPTDETLFRWTP